MSLRRIYVTFLWQKCLKRYCIFLDHFIDHFFGVFMTSQSLIQLLGGVGIFLFAIKLISQSLQSLAGNRLRSLIHALTKTPVLGVFVGTFVTVLLQSSSATTVMTVSFVDAGLMTLQQAIGVIMGANIGTTVTGQIIAFKVKDFAYLFVVAGVFMNFFFKNEFYKYLGNGLLAFGLLFIGMQTMENAMYFLRDRQDIFITFSHNPLLGVLAGTLLTLLVQSSSATVGLTIALGAQGILPLEAAIPIILGDNIGTTITAILASIGTNKAAKQTCAAHVLFNFFGVCLFLPLMPVYLPFLAGTSEHITHQIANSHTLFNVCNTLIFLPFTGIFARFIKKMIPDEVEVKKEGALYLDPKLIESSPIVAVNAVNNECIHLAQTTNELLDEVENILFNNEPQKISKANELEDKVDMLYHSINQYASTIMKSAIPDEVVQKLYAYVSVSSDLERIGDKANDLIKFYNYRSSSNAHYKAERIEELHTMYKTARHAFTLAFSALAEEAETKEEVKAIAKKLRKEEIKFRTSAMTDVCQGESNPQAERLFIDSISAIERIAYRSNKVAHKNIDEDLDIISPLQN